MSQDNKAISVGTPIGEKDPKRSSSVAENSTLTHQNTDINTNTYTKSPSPSTPNTPKKRVSSKSSARTRAREFVVQALYQFIVGKNQAPDVDLFTRGLSGFSKADSVHYDLLLYGICEQSSALDQLITPHLDRPLTEISPVERSVMWVGAFELKNCLDIPAKVVINESVELAKGFGGTDGHKYVNAVINGLAHALRAREMTH